MRVAVFCGANVGNAPKFAACARELGTALARAGIGIVYGGASRGLMGEVADAGIAAGGEVIGVLPRALNHREIAHPGISALHLVDTMHERKALITELSDAFIALPGGIGTLDEFFEAFTWAQIGIHSKPIALLDLDGYYQPLLTFLREIVGAGFLAPARLDSLVVCPDVPSFMSSLASVSSAPIEPRYASLISSSQS